MAATDLLYWSMAPADKVEGVVSYPPRRAYIIMRKHFADCSALDAPSKDKLENKAESSALSLW